MMSFKSSICIQYSSAREIRRNSKFVDGILEDYTTVHILSTFPLKSSFSILEERQENTSNSVNDVTVINIKPL